MRLCSPIKYARLALALFLLTEKTTDSQDFETKLKMRVLAESLFPSADTTKMKETKQEKFKITAKQHVYHPSNTSVKWGVRVVFGRKGEFERRDNGILLKVFHKSCRP